LLAGFVARAAPLVIPLPDASPEVSSNSSALSNTTVSSPAAPAHPPTFGEILAAPHSPISGNPGAVNFMTGDGLLQSLTPVSPDTGVHFGGIWLADYNYLIAGGADPGASSWNSLLIASVQLDAAKLLDWQGADFGVQFLQFNGENTNGEAGAFPGYNSLPGPPPLDRSELYQAWYRQKLFDNHLIIRIGKTVPTYDFDNVTRPVSTDLEDLEVPAVSGLIYTPIFINPTMLGALPGYYNSAYGVTVTVAPVKHFYFNYGFYDGALAQGVQTGLVGPQFNTYYFNIAEVGTDWVIADKYPGQFGAGAWYQSGTLTAPHGVTQDGTSGFYLFGGQRIWGRDAAPAVTRVVNGQPQIVTPTHGQNASVSVFYQFGINDSKTLLVTDYVGAGLTGFGLIPGRPEDSIGGGLGQSWLNKNVFNRSSQLMLQTYYQAHIYGGLFLQPTLSYIPTPAASNTYSAAWAFTMRLTFLF
jgi:porin